MTDEGKKRRILELLARGQKYKQIAWELGMSSPAELSRELGRLGIPGRRDPFSRSDRDER